MRGEGFHRAGKKKNVEAGKKGGGRVGKGSEAEISDFSCSKVFICGRGGGTVVVENKGVGDVCVFDVRAS